LKATNKVGPQERLALALIGQTAARMWLHEALWHGGNDVEDCKRLCEESDQTILNIMSKIKGKSLWK